MNDTLANRLRALAKASDIHFRIALDEAFVLELADLLEQVGGRDVPASNAVWWDRADALRDRLPQIESDRK